MPKPTIDEIVTQGHKRYFYQVGGASPYNDIMYAGEDGEYMNIESASVPVGDISAINVQNPKKTKSFRRVGRERSAPDLPTATIQFLQHHGAIPRHLYNLVGCVATYYEPTGKCLDPSDLLNGWSDYVKIYSLGEATNLEEMGSAFDADAMVIDDVDKTFDNIYVAGAISFGEKATTEVTQEVIDIVYGSRVQCTECGPQDDGTKLVYALTDGVSGSTGSLPTVYYSTDGGATWTADPVSTALATDTAVSIDVVGQKLMVTVQDATTGGYYLSDINRLTGVPGAWSAKVTTGFVSGNVPNDVYVSSPREVFFCADNGYVYKSTSISQGVSVLDAGDATTENLNRIHGYEGTIVCGADNDKIIYTLNRGQTWALTTNDPGAGGIRPITAVQVIGEFMWWVGNNIGEVYYTNTQGEAAWTQLTLPTTSAGTIANISDIVFATDEIGYITAETGSNVAVLFHTFTGGELWDKASGSDTNDGRVIGTLPTSDKWARVAYPMVDNFAVASNNVALGGLAGDGSDGIILIGAAEVKG